MSRSSDERESARLERERRRAAGRGDAPEIEPEPPVEPDPGPPSSGEDVLTELSPAPSAETDAAWSWDQAAAESPVIAEPAPAPVMRSFPSPPPPDWHPDDDPIGTISGPQPGAPGMSPHRPVTVRRRRRRPPGRLLLLFVPLVILLIVAVYVVNAVFTPFKGDGSGEVVVRIPDGASTREIGDLLADRGVVGSGAFFAMRSAIFLASAIRSLAGTTLLIMPIS